MPSPRGTHRDERLQGQMTVIATLVVIAVIISIAAGGVALTVSSALTPAVDLQVRHEVVRLNCTLGGVEKDGQELISCVPRH